ncbi:MAG TPA: restriction endonuclease subunit S [Opitutaceae bacterium]|nr:restriction endonuclease subunit S [Opitutaceae bacterium]
MSAPNAAQFDRVEPATLPAGWATARIGDVLKLYNGAAFKPSQWSTSGLPIIRIQNLNKKDAPFNYFDGEINERFRVRNGDLLFAWSGTPGTSFGAHIWKGGDAWLNQHIFRVEFDRKHFDSEFLRIAINRNLNAYIAEAHGGAGLAHITKVKFESFHILLPPLPEQRRIVARLEALQARSRRARAKLAEVPTQLAKARQSLLAAAFRGELTAEWRKQNPKLSAADELAGWLARRFETWVAANPKTPKARYKAPSTPTITGHEELTETWTLVGPEQVAQCDSHSLGIGPFGSDLKVADYREEGVPLVFVRDIRSRRFGTDAPKFITVDKASALGAHRVTAGDLLVTKMGEPPGDTAVYPAGRPDGVITADCIRLRPETSVTTSTYLAFALRCPFARSQIDEQSAGVAQQKISLGRFATVAIPLAPLPEQHEIVRRLTAAFAKLDAAAAAHVAAVADLDRLDQSILARAFSGGL